MKGSFKGLGGFEGVLLRVPASFKRNPLEEYRGALATGGSRFKAVGDEGFRV